MFRNWLIRALLFSTNGLSVIMYASLAYEGLFARFCNIFAIYTDGMRLGVNP